MATIHFYEKPGCLNNARQKQLLVAAGHILIVHDLLQQPWARQREKLRSFFGETPVSDWFNRSAPAIRQGRVHPGSLSEDQAIELMVADPLLIRRPLLEAGGKRCAGFDAGHIEEWLAISLCDSNLETCPKHNHSTTYRP